MLSQSCVFLVFDEYGVGWLVDWLAVALRFHNAGRRAKESAKEFHVLGSE